MTPETTRARSAQEDLMEKFLTHVVKVFVAALVGGGLGMTGAWLLAYALSDEA